MTGKRNNATEQTGPNTSAGAWGLRYPGLVMTTGGKNEVKEFTGMWRLKPDADLVAFTDALSREVPIWGGPGRTFSEATTMLGLIRSARWFVARTQDFNGYTLFFISQFDGTLDKYFDDFVLNGKDNLMKIWGQCVGCPIGPDVTARDVVEYIARGQIKTLACYDVVPSLSIGQTLQNGRLVREDAEVPAGVGQGRRQTGGQGQRVPERAGRALQARSERCHGRYGCRPPVAVRGCRRTGQPVQSGDRSIKERRCGGGSTLAPRQGQSHHRPYGFATEDYDHARSDASRTLTAADLKENLHDIQDNVVAPILMRYGRHLFVKFEDGTKARAWLRNMLKHVNMRSKEHGTRFTVNIGFTYQGLKALGLSQRSLDSFPEAFRVGMRGRAKDVGDLGPHAPEHWEAGLGGPDIHAMGLIRTDSEEGRELAARIIRAEMEATGGVDVRFVQDTMALAHENGIGSEGEHFGFADPISQPPIEGADAPSYPGDGVLEQNGTWRPLKPGEFLLGYEDEAGDAGTQAPEPPELRLNGTYVVFRKLYQDVAAFRQYLARPQSRFMAATINIIRIWSRPR